MLKLYDYYRSSASFRVRIALNLKQLDYRIIPIHLVNNGGEQHGENYQAINPQCLIPSLDVDNRVLTQSLAIIEYLDEVHPKPALLPNTAYEKALVRSYANLIAADIHPLNNLRVLNYLTDELQASDDQKNAWYQHWISSGLAALEKLIVNHNLSGDFCFGFVPTIADICLVPQLYNARRFHCDLKPYPNLVRIDANCRKIHAFEYAFPKEPVTAKEIIHA